MRIKILLFALCLSLIPIWAGAATYYMRADGTAANKAAASGPCATQANCMSIATHDADTYAADDTIILCDDGGVYRDQMDIPSSGSDGSPITYEAASEDNSSGLDSVIIYPDVPYAVASTTYSMTVNGQTVFVEDRGDDRNYAHFSFAGEVDIVVTVSEAVTSHTLSPTSYNISSTSPGSTIVFSLDRPRKLMIHEVNALTEMLFIFADPLETNPPKLGDANVTNVMDAAGGIDNLGRTDELSDIQGEIDTISGAAGGVLYFPPGRYYISGHLYVKEDVRIYLAGGARLYYPGGTWKYIYFNNADDTSIEGRGSIDGPMVMSYGGSTNVTLQGITILPHVDGWWAVEAEYTTNFIAYNVKIINDASITSDGFDIENSSTALVDDCFVYSGDDAFVVHSKNEGALPGISNINFRNSVAWAGSSACKISQESYAPTVSDITWENIDVLSFSHRAVFINNRYVSEVSDVFFKNIRVETFTDRGLGDEYLVNYQVWDASTGGIDSVYLQNLIVDGSLSAMNSRITGLEPGDEVTNTTLDNWYIGANLMENTTESNMTTNEFIDAPVWANTDPSIVSITATDLYMSEGDSGVFTISRTGSTASAITVNYTVRGTATNGTDYETIASSAIIAEGSSSTTIAVSSVADNVSEGVETIFLSLSNDAHDTNFLLGPNFLAVMNIYDNGGISGADLLSGWTNEGSELVTNGTFDANVTGWTRTPAATIAYEAGPIGGISNVMKFTSGGTEFQYLYQSGLSLSSSSTYRFSYDAYLDSGNGVSDGTIERLSDPSGENLNELTGTADTWLEFTQILSPSVNRDDIYFYFTLGGSYGANSTANGEIIYYDNISVKEQLPYWKVALTTEPDQVFFDGVLGTLQASAAACTSARDWYWDANVLYVYSLSNPNIAYTNPGIEASIRDYCINFNGKNYVDVSGLQVMHANVANILIDGTNCDVSKIRSIDPYTIGVSLTGTDNTVRQSLIVRGSDGISDSGGSNDIFASIIDDSGDDGVIVTAAGSKFYNLTIYSAAGDGIELQANAEVKNTIFEAITGSDINENGGAGTTSNNYADATGDPLFTDAASDDFTLKPNSPAIDAGVDLGASYDDALSIISSWPSSVTTETQYYDGRFDIGAFRFPNWGGE